MLLPNSKEIISIVSSKKMVNSCSEQVEICKAWGFRSALQETHCRECIKVAMIISIL